ncbi:MAG TPA: STAS/SEC14 domain-containing protein [Pelomicrobium sp.]|nr:STAS/SEC14 domain-containing protein [Pelomicrobium sp.]
MIDLIGTDADNVVGFRLRGDVESADFGDVARLIEERQRAHERVRLYAELECDGEEQLAAFLKRFGYAVRNLRAFEKEAVVSAEPWPETMAVLLVKSVPALEVKRFGPDEREQALAWVRS